MMVRIKINNDINNTTITISCGYKRRRSVVTTTMTTMMMITMMTIMMTMAMKRSALMCVCVCVYLCVFVYDYLLFLLSNTFHYVDVKPGNTIS